MKRAKDIEELLTWAYCEELWKRDVSSAEANWDNISIYGGLGAISVDESSRPQRYASVGAPHPDAVIIDHQVNGLAELLGGSRGVATIDYQHSREILFGSLLGYAPDTMALRPYKIGEMVKSAALLKRRPTWNVGRIRVARVHGPNGKPKLLNDTGRDPVRPNGKYNEGTYCALVVDPPIREIAETRAEYLLWHRALVELRSVLADSLVAHAPTFPQAPQTPWLDAPVVEAGRKPKLLVTPQVIAAIHEGRKKRRLRAS